MTSARESEGGTTVGSSGAVVALGEAREAEDGEGSPVEAALAGEGDRESELAAGVVGAASTDDSDGPMSATIIGSANQIARRVGAHWNSAERIVSASLVECRYRNLEEC
jgi:hypothetical protein